MNSFFNLKRFARLFRYEIVTNYKYYGLFLGGITFFLSAILTFNMYGSIHSGTYHYSNYIPWLIIFIVGMGTIGISTAFPATKNKVTLSGYLMLPASIFEKYLVQFVVRVVLLIPILLFIFWIDAQIARKIVMLIYDGEIIEFEAFSFSKIFYMMNTGQHSFMAKCLIYSGTMAAISFLFCMATFFNRYKLFKAVITYFIIIMLFLLSMTIYSHLFFSEKLDYLFDIYVQEYFISKEWNNIPLFFTILSIGLSLFMLPLGYFKLKEREV